jgi:hypothetical protein
MIRSTSGGDANKDDMMMLRKHEISDRRFSEPCYSVAPISFMDPTVCITLC